VMWAMLWPETGRRTPIVLQPGCGGAQPSSRMYSNQRPLYPPPYLGLLTCWGVTNEHRNLLLLPTHNMGLWRRCRFCRKRMTMSYLGVFSNHGGLCNCHEPKYILFTLPMSFTSAKGNFDHTGRKCNIQRATCSVQLHAHNSFVFHSIIAAPRFVRQDSIINRFWVSLLCPATTFLPYFPDHKEIS
jgi:hypothetical protein